MKSHLVLSPESPWTCNARDLLRADGCRLVNEDPPDKRRPIMLAGLPYGRGWPSDMALLEAVRGGVKR
jgi:hypothetical protein